MNHAKEFLNINRSIIVLPKSPLPTTSPKTSMKPIHSAGKLSPCPDQNSNSKLSDPPKMDASTQLSSKGVSPPQSPQPNQCDIRISNVQSIGKTSVIRLASPKKPPPPPITETNIRPLLKTPFSKQPKKIVVKFKKPFVPVVEEDANLQPPEKITISSDNAPAKCVESISSDPTSSKIDEHIDHPFSPLRQTFTPPPPIYSLISKNRDDVEDAELIVDLRTKESIVKEHIDDMAATDGPIETSINEREGNEDNMDIDDSIINSHKCDNEIFTIEFKENDMNESNADVKNVVLKIKVEVNPKQFIRDESILADRKDTIVLPESCSTDLSSTSSQPTTSSQTRNNFNEAGPSRIDYGLSSFEDFYSSVRLSPISFTPENYAWNQRFSPQYVPFDNEKNSYMDLDMYKNTNSYEERAPSTDSLNIRTDEKMPAKGEISEQESNGDVEGSSWSHQVSGVTGKILYLLVMKNILPHRCIRYKTHFHDIQVLMIQQLPEKVGV